MSFSLENNIDASSGVLVVPSSQVIESLSLGGEGVRIVAPAVGLPGPSSTVALGVGPVELIGDGSAVSTRLAKLADIVWLVEVVLGVGYEER